MSYRTVICLALLTRDARHEPRLGSSGVGPDHCRFHGEQHPSEGRRRSLADQRCGVR
jgi:hypothetical protein